MQISYVVIYPVLTCVLDAHDALSSWASARTCGQWPADFALLSISWIVFFLESGSFLDTSTGWRQRMSPACTQTVRGKPTGSNHATSNTAESYSRPKMGVARFSTRETVEGKPATMHTIPSKKVEWGATARMGASPLLTWVPFTTTRKPMQKKYALPKAAITLRHMNLQSGVTIVRQKEMFYTHYLKLETYSVVVTGRRTSCHMWFHHC